MASKRPETFCMEIPVNDPEKMEAFNKFMDELQDRTVEYCQQLAEELGISERCAGLVYYLRSRSRWTQEKEDRLIQLDKEGKELPNVLAGEF